MRTRLSKLFERLRSSYWFVPSALAAFALLLSYGMIRVDRALDLEVEHSFWLYTGHASAALDVLSTVATATITIATLTFSVTIVALTLAASQYGPRLLYNFMRDRANQVVLGVLIGGFLYSLMVLRAVQGDDAAFVPQLSVTLAVVLALLGVAALIYFIHHTAETIQADNLIAAVSRDLADYVRDVLPPVEKESEYQREAEDGQALWRQLQADSATIRAQASGFLQAINLELLESMAARHDLVLRVLKRPGEFVTHETDLLALHPAARLAKDLVRIGNDAFVLGARRTLIQDVELPFQQLAEVAVRGLSPGVYDPFTALRCIARLADGLILAMGRGEPRQVRRDADGRIRLLLSVPSFASIAKAALGDLYAYGASNTPVMQNLLETLAELLHCARTQSQREALLSHAHRIYQAAHERAADTGRRSLDQARARLLAVAVSSAGPSATRSAPAAHSER